METRSNIEHSAELKWVYRPSWQWMDIALYQSESSDVDKRLYKPQHCSQNSADNLFLQRQRNLNSTRILSAVAYRESLAPVARLGISFVCNRDAVSYYPQRPLHLQFAKFPTIELKGALYPSLHNLHWITFDACALRYISAAVHANVNLLAAPAVA